MLNVYLVQQVVRFKYFLTLNSWFKQKFLLHLQSKIETKYAEEENCKSNL